MKLSIAMLASALVLIGAAPAQADFGFLPGAEGLEVTATEEGGGVERRAGAHPATLRTEVNFNLAPG